MNNHKEISPARSIIPERCVTVSIIVPLSNSKAGNFVMRTCSRCKKELSHDRFYEHGGWCKGCWSESSMNYSRSKSGVISSSYRNQKLSSKRRGYPQPSYSMNELREWCLSQPLFHELYSAWVKSGYDKWLKPSIDRKNDYEGYSFGNIQITTWYKNSIKGYNDIIIGKNRKASVAVLQYDLDGNYIDEYYSISEANRRNGFKTSHIGEVCRGNYKTSRGYIWKFKDK